MNHQGTINLQTDRLILRRFTLDDAIPMYDNWASNPNVTKYLTWPVHPNTEVTKQVIKSWIKEYENNNYYQWAIVLKENNIIVGSISVVNINEQANKVEIGYCIGEKWWNKGITSESLSMVIDFLFNKVNVNKIIACHDTRNINSGKVMSHCNMKCEGILKQEGKTSSGEICDLAYYAILKEEYK